MITVEHLTKCYGDFLAVDDLSFEIEEGHVYGFLGPNGAGKSTTMNIMTGCLSASSGSVTVGGHDIFEEAGPAKRLLGYLPERPPLYLDRTPWEYLSFVGQAKGVAKEDLDEQIHHVMEVTRIADVSQRLIKNLSKGYQQRVGIARALAVDPQIIFADEPTGNLDSKTTMEVLKLMQTIVRERNQTLVMVTHDNNLATYADRIIKIIDGKIVSIEENHKEADLEAAREEGAQKNKDCKEAAREETPQKKMTEEKESGENL